MLTPLTRVERLQNLRSSRLLRTITVLALLVAPLSLLGAAPAQAATTLSIRPLTWDVIGIDSNKPTDAGAGVGPNVFPVGARVCNTGAETATALRADLLFGGDKTIDNRFLTVEGADVVTFGDLAAGACADAYFNVQVQRTTAAYDTTQPYTIVASSGSAGTVSTPTNRQLYVERLISQNRNSVTSITGPTTVFVGGTYTYRVVAKTATQGYEQLESFLTFPNTIFQLLSARTTYSTAPGAVPNDTLYADACTWDPNIGPRPPDGTYLSCLGDGKAGGDITMEYVVKVTEAGSGTLSSLIYDYSGSSFHYNGDYGTPVNALRVTTVDSDMSITKTHSPAVLQRGSQATYALTVTNAGSASVDGPFTVTDTLPAGLSFVSASGSGFSGCAASGQTVTCQLAGPIAAGGTRELRLVVAVGDAAAASVTNTAAVSLGESESDTANNTATDVALVNSAPVAVVDSTTTTQGTAVALSPLANDTDRDGDALTITATTPPLVAGSTTPTGTVTCSGTSCTYTPPAGFVGTVRFDYTISDGRGGTSTTTVTVNVANRAPEFTAATTNTSQSTSATGATFTPLAATDADGDPLSYALTGGALPAGVTLGTDGTLAVAPGSTLVPGTYTAAVTVSDGKGGADTTNLVVVVSDPSTARLGDLVFSDTDGDGVRDAGEPGLAGATVSVSRDGAVVATARTDADGLYVVTGLPAGTYAVDVTPPDGHVKTTTVTAPLSRTLTVGQVVTDADLGARPLNGSVTVTVFTDFDADRTQDTGELVRAGTVVTATSTGTTTSVTTNDAGNAVFSLPPGSYTFTVTPAPGETVTTGTTSAVVTAGSSTPGLLIGLDVNRPPVADDESVATPRDTAVSTDPLVGDTDPDTGDTLAVSSVSAPVVVGGTSVGAGTVTCTATTCTYTPAAGFEGTVTYDYTVSDGNGGTDVGRVTVTIGGNPPAFTTSPDNTGQTVAVGQDLRDLVATDPDGPPLSFTVVGGSLPPGVLLDPVTGALTGPTTTAGTFTAQIEVSDGVRTDVTTLVVVVNEAPAAGGPTAAADAVRVPTGATSTVAVLTNDTLVDPVTLTVGMQPAAGTGTVTCETGPSTSTPAPVCTYVPADGFAGTTTFTYTITDSSGRASTATVTLTVNTPPVFTSPAARTVQEGAGLAPLTATDADGDPVTFALVGPDVLPPGITELRPDGSFAGAATAPGRYEFVVVATDGQGGTTRQTVTVVVNDVPQFAAGTSDQTVAVGGTTSPLPATDSDPGETLTYTSTGTLPPGVVLATGPLASGVDPLSGSPTTPGTYTSTITVTDSRGGTDSIVLTVTVPGPAAGATLGDTVFADANGNGVQDAGEPVYSSPVTVVVEGPVTASRTVTTGSYTFTDLPAGTYTVRLTDLPAGSVQTSALGTVTLSSGQMRTDVDLGVQRRDTSVPVLVFQDENRNGVRDGTEGPASGVVVTLSGGGILGTSQTTGADGTTVFTGLPAAEYAVTTTPPTGSELTTAGTTRPTTVSGTATAQQVFGVRLLGVAPVAVDDRDGTPRGVAVTTAVLANDTDADGDPLSVTTTTTDAFLVGADGVRTTTVTGTVTCTTTGCRFTPPAGFSGTVAYDYVVSDGRRSDTGTVTVIVGNSPPAFTGAAVNTRQDVPSGGTLSRVTATDVDADPVTYALVAGALPPGVTLNDDGTFAGSPVNTTDAVVTYTVTIRATSAGPLTDDTVLVVRVLPANRAPVYTGDAGNTTQSVPVGGPLAPLRATDPDGDPLGYALVSGELPPGVQLNANGNLEGTPTTAGTYTVTVRVADPAGLADTTTLVITVTEPGTAGTAPVATDDTGSTPVDTAVTVPVTANDTDAEGDPLTATVLTQPANGTATCSAGSCTYTPRAGSTGTDTFTYTVSDGRGGSDVGQVTVTVTAPGAVPDQPPVFDGPASQSVPVGTPVAPLRATDPEGGQVVLTLGPDAVLPPGVSALRPDGTFAGTPDTPGTYRFAVVLTDPQGASTTVTVTIVVPDTAPVARDDRYGVPAGATTALPVLDNDSDAGGGAVTVVAHTQPATGTVTCAGSGCSYTAPAGAEGSTVTFTYTIEDTRPAGVAPQRDTAQVTLVIGPVGSPVDAPPAFTDAPSNAAQTVPVGSPLAPVVATTDPGDTPLVYTVDPATLPPGVTGLVPETGAFTGVPTTPGTFPVVVTVTDPSGASDTTVVVVTVTNRAPRAVDDSATTAQGTPVGVAVLGNDTDPDGQALRVVRTTAPANGTATCTPAGQCTYTPAAGFSGTDRFTYTVADGSGGTDTATVTVTVVPQGVPAVPAPAPAPPSPSAAPSPSVAPSPSASPGPSPSASPSVSPPAPTAGAPTARDDAARTTAGTPVAVPVLANDTDPDGDRLTVTLATRPASGTATCTATGCTYVPETGFTGTDTFTYAVSDGKGGTDTATVTVTVAAGPAVNTPPVARDDRGTTTVGTAVRLPLLDNDTDVDGDRLAVTASTRPAHGTVVCTSTGCTYTPRAGFVGTDTFTYTVSDGKGGTDTATATVVVGSGPGTGTGGDAGSGTGAGTGGAGTGGAGSGTGGTGSGVGSGTGVGTGVGTGTGTPGTGTSGTGTSGTGSSGTGGGLPRTGSDVGALGLGGAALVLLGGLALLAVRPTRRRLTTA